MALSFERAASVAPVVAAARAEAAWGQRRRLVALAASSLRHREDAEDVASEAISRVLCAEVPIEAIPAWLTTVTRRLVVDEVRKRQRHLRLVSRLGAVLEPHAESEIETRLDQAEADWLLGIVAELPARQRAAMLAHAGGRDIAGVAEILGITYKAAEHLVGRARAGLRASAKATWVAIVALLTLRTARRSIAMTPSAALVVSASLGLLVLAHAEELHANHQAVRVEGLRPIPSVVGDTSHAANSFSPSPTEGFVRGAVAKADLLVPQAGLVPTQLVDPTASVASTHSSIFRVVQSVPQRMPAGLGGPVGTALRPLMCVSQLSCDVGVVRIHHPASVEPGRGRVS